MENAPNPLIDLKTNNTNRIRVTNDDIFIYEPLSYVSQPATLNNSTIP